MAHFLKKQYLSVDLFLKDERNYECFALLAGSGRGCGGLGFCVVFPPSDVAYARRQRPYAAHCRRRAPGGDVLSPSAIQGCRCGVPLPRRLVLRHGLWFRRTKSLGARGVPDGWFFLGSGWLSRHAHGHAGFGPHDGGGSPLAQRRVAHRFPQWGGDGAGCRGAGVARHFFLVCRPELRHS